MSLDGLVLHALVHELQACVNARIAKIYQPTDNEMVWHIRGQGVNGRLLLSAHPSMPRLHWTAHTWANPEEPPMFCMLLRKYCEGGVIEAIRQIGLERIVEIDIRHRDELGDDSMKRVILEIMGRHSNLILMDPATGVVHDGIRHVTPAISSYRVVLPGVAYVAPPSQDKRNPLEADAETVRALLAEEAYASDPAGALLQRYSGISPLVATELHSRSGGDPESLVQQFISTMAQVASHNDEPNIVETDNGKMVFSSIRLTHLNGQVIRFDKMHSCLDAFYKDKAQRDLVKQRTADLSRLLHNETAKNKKKLQKLQETLEEAEADEHYRRLGELLTSQLHLAHKGDTSVDVVDYYDEHQQTVTITLDPQLAPADNAQRLFRKYTKLRNSRSIVAQQMQGAEEELDYLASVLQGLETALPHDIEEIRDELIEQGYIRARGPKRGMKKKKKDRPAVLCYTSSEGIPIYVGKNNTQNDYISNRLGAPTDTWLHTKDIPGSHVLIRSTEFGETTLLEAAALAAYYSKARESSGVPVDYTRIRHVRKPSGAKPGFVIYDNQKTLFVTPDPVQIDKLASELK